MATDNFVDLTIREAEQYLEVKDGNLFVKGTNIQILNNKSSIGSVSEFLDLYKNTTYRDELILNIPENNYRVKGNYNKPQKIKLSQVKLMDSNFNYDGFKPFSPEDLGRISDKDVIVVDSEKISNTYRSASLASQGRGNKAFQGTVSKNIIDKNNIVKSIMDNYNVTKEEVINLYSTDNSVKYLDSSDVSDFFKYQEEFMKKGLTEKSKAKIYAWAALRNANEVNPIDYYFRTMGGYIVEDVAYNKLNASLEAQGYKLVYNNDETIIDNDGKVKKDLSSTDITKKPDYRLVKYNKSTKTISELKTPVYLDAKSVLTAANDIYGREDFTLYDDEARIKSAYVLDDMKAEELKSKIDASSLDSKTKGNFKSRITSYAKTGLIAEDIVDDINSKAGVNIIDKNNLSPAKLGLIISQASGEGAQASIAIANSNTIENNVKPDVGNKCNAVFLNSKTGGNVDSVSKLIVGMVK